MTKDLAVLISEKQKYLTTQEFLNKLVENMEQRKAA